MTTFDAIVIGAGPAGSHCARTLVRGGLKVALIDRAAFPRTKLCAGWVSKPVWEVLELAPESYPHGLWRWSRCHVHFGGRHHVVPVEGAFIRRFEFDEFLLRRSGATVVEGHHVTRVEQERTGWWMVDDTYRAPIMIGAGGARCPVARAVFPRKPGRPVGTLEAEVPIDAEQLANSRIGRDGEPELLLHDDLSGYSWNVPKSGWLNVGCGTADPKMVRAAWRRAEQLFEELGHLPPEAKTAAGRLKGHFYHLFAPSHLDNCYLDGAYLVGDALGLAHPLTAEGILPALVSGRLCAEAVLAGTPAQYRRRLWNHSIVREYRAIYYLRQAVIASGARRRGTSHEISSIGELLRCVLLAHGFARLFSGRLV